MFNFPNKPIKIRESILKTLNLDEWIAQPKWNGHRCNPQYDGKQLEVLSRHGTPLTLAAGKWSHLVSLPLPRPWALDGELTRSGRLILWDWSLLDGKNGSDLAYHNRLDILSGFDLSYTKGVELIETLPARDWRKIWARKGEPDLEGVVFKRKDARDLWGGTSTKEVAGQLKMRFSDLR